jgi:TIR domain
MNDGDWKRLLQKIEDGNVVPIIGSRLLVETDGKTSLQARMAERLLEDAGKPSDISLTPYRELKEPVFRLQGDSELDGEELYDRVHDAILSVIHPKGAAPPTPEPIRQLSQIADFRLYVTLTPDDLLADSLKKRCAVNEIIYSPKLPTKESKDLPDNWFDRTGEVYVLYLFGKLRSSPVFAIHDEDVLEYAHNLIARGSQVPTTFLGELQQRNLLLVGCNFPEWVTRFFLRACNQKRLSENDRRSWFIEPLPPEDHLTIFLQSYSKQTEVLSQSSPVEFVAELHRRWMDAHGGAQTTGALEERTQSPRAMFFISYSRTDLAQAESIYKALLGLGVSEAEVWFDRQALEPGENYQRKILDGIQGCRYFLPMLSSVADRRQQGFVFKEWEEASDRLSTMNREFVLPIVVDTEYHPEIYHTESICKWRDKKIDFGFAPNGSPDERLEKKLQELLRGERRGGGPS